MAQAEVASTSDRDKTFRNYNSEQGKYYAQARRDYHPNVYKQILDRHASSGGEHDTVLDAGCGPGNVARSLAPHFAHVIGLDPSAGMVETARSLGGTSSTSEAIRFEIGTAEELGHNATPPVGDASVDLIVAGNAAHWFEMPAFWHAAARVLKPGGSVALWTSGGIRLHPSTPNATELQEAMDRFDEEHLRPYDAAGNATVRNYYRDLPLPWTLDPPLSEFDPEAFFRKDWDIEDQFYQGSPAVDMDTVEKMMGTVSQVTRWREAHPQDVGTERDVAKMYRKLIETKLQEAGVEKGQETLRGGTRGVTLVVKKKR